ncbi:hypothetical protein KEM52_000786 [Ascosphaera acerosa]|nr:hypothetical protein KEM52_000786 [Ascosphaera acerosa]
MKLFTITLLAVAAGAVDLPDFPDFKAVLGAHGDHDQLAEVWAVAAPEVGVKFDVRYTSDTDKLKDKAPLAFKLHNGTIGDDDDCSHFELWNPRESDEDCAGDPDACPLGDLTGRAGLTGQAPLDNFDMIDQSLDLESSMDTFVGDKSVFVFDKDGEVLNCGSFSQDVRKLKMLRRTKRKNFESNRDFRKADEKNLPLQCADWIDVPVAPGSHRKLSQCIKYKAGKPKDYGWIW